MLTSNQVSGLKKSNASVDANKTRARVSEDFKAATTEQKKDILELSGLSANSYYNVGKSGTASPRLVIGLSQVLGISPYYYTGETDEKDTLTEEISKEFFAKFETKKDAPRKTKTTKSAKSKGHVKAAGRKPKATPKPKPVKAPATAVNKASKTTAKKEPAKKRMTQASKKVISSSVKTSDKLADTAGIELDNSAAMNKAIKDLTSENAVLLLQALSIRAKTSVKYKEVYDLVKRCLLS